MTHSELLASILNKKTRTEEFTAKENEVHHKGELIAFHDPKSRLFIVQGADRLLKVYSVHEAADLIIKNLQNGND